MAKWMMVAIGIPGLLLMAPDARPSDPPRALSLNAVPTVSTESTIRRRPIRRPLKPTPVEKQYMVPQVEPGETLRFRNYGEPTSLRVCWAPEDCEEKVLDTNGTAEFTSPHDEQVIASVWAKHDDVEGRADHFDPVHVREFEGVSVLPMELPNAGQTPMPLRAYAAADKQVKASWLNNLGEVLKTTTWDVSENHPFPLFFDTSGVTYTQPMTIIMEGAHGYQGNSWHSSGSEYNESWIIGATNVEKETVSVHRIPPMDVARSVVEQSLTPKDSHTSIPQTWGYSTSRSILFSSALKDWHPFTGTGTIHYDQQDASHTHQLWAKYVEDGEAAPLPIVTRGVAANAGQDLWFSFLTPNHDLRIANLDGNDAVTTVITGYRNGVATTSISVPLSGRYNTNLQNVATQLGGADQIRVEAMGEGAHVGAVLFTETGNHLGFVRPR
jgi:hypothetical protein